MTDRLLRFVADELNCPVPPAVTAMSVELARRLSGVAVLYYGSTLRTGDLDGGVLDFYVLTARPTGSLLRRLGLRWLWPDVSYHEIAVDGRTLRAKVATMPVATFERAARGEFLDTTIMARFVQPAGLVWREDAAIAARVAKGVAEAIRTAARFAAVIGPVSGTATDYWQALFRETYSAELRVEPPGREVTIIQHDPARYARLLPLAWVSGKIAFVEQDGALTPDLDEAFCRRTVRAWLWRAASGKALNVARLVKAVFTFDGAPEYALWKLNRHKGTTFALTPFRRRHPILAAAGVLWQVRRAS